jgi:hypothetical protein
MTRRSPWRSGGFYVVVCQGSFAEMVWPLGLCALLEFVVGIGMTLNAHRSLGEGDRALIPSIAQLESQVKNYGIARRVELALIAIALILCFIFPMNRTGFAMALGVTSAAIPLWAFDSFGLQRATANLRQAVSQT